MMKKVSSFDCMLRGFITKNVNVCFAYGLCCIKEPGMIFLQKNIYLW